MINSLLGYKLKETQQFTPEGKRVPATWIQAGPCWVTRIQDLGRYQNLQLGFGTKKHVAKPQEGHIKKAGLAVKPRFFREIRVEAIDETIKLGSKITLENIFAVGDRIRVTGTSKGKGFAGVVKRHGFAGGPRTHGQSDRERAPGSIGQTTTPGRVYKGKRMAGRMGNQRVTVPGLTVLEVDPENNIMVIKGLVSGAKNGLLLIQKEV